MNAPQPRRVVVLGATSGIGRAIARELAAHGDAFLLLGRDDRELARSAADLEARGAETPVVTHRLDLGDGEPDRTPLIAALREKWGVPDWIVVTAGLYGTQADLERDPTRLATLLDVNFTQTVMLIEAMRPWLLEGGGTLCVISSVAADAPRRTSVLYGASKAGLSYYLDGLDRRFHRDGLRVIHVKPGFVRTPMTAGLPETPFASDVEPVARRIVRACGRGACTLYAPPIWRGIMAIIRRLPRALMRRVEF